MLPETSRSYRGRSAGHSNYQGKVIINPQHEDISVQDRLQIGNKAFADGQHLAAQAAFKAVIERDPNNAQALLGMARVLLDRGDPVKALDYARGALSINGPSFQAYMVMARAHLARKEWSLAEAEALRAQAIKPGDPAPLLTLADAALQAGGREREIEFLRGKLDAVGMHIPLLLRLADALVIAGRETEALSALEGLDITGLGPEQKVRLHKISARAHLVLGHLDHAEAEALRARAIKPGDPAPVLFMAQVTLIREGRAREAEFLRRNLEGLNNSFKVRMRLATIYQSEGRHSEALDVLQALEMSFLNDEERLKLAGFFTGLGRADLAEAAYRQVNRRGSMGGAILLYEAMNGTISPGEALKAHCAIGLKNDLFLDALLALALTTADQASQMDVGEGDLLRRRLDTIRLSAGHRAELQSGYEAADAYCRPSDDAWGRLPLVSVICPVHRVEDVANLIDQLLRQDYPRIEPVIVINGPQIDAGWIRERLLASGRFDHVCMLEYPEDTMLGRCLNLGVAHSSGDYIARFDADDRYLEAYLSKTMNFMLTHSAAICGKYGLLFFFESMGLVALKECRDVAAYAVMSNAFLFPGGSTIVLRRDAALSLPFDEMSNLGEDLDFWARAYGAGFRTVYAPPFDHIVMRKADLAQHTWRQQDINLLLNIKPRLTGAADAAGVERWLGAL